jgi:site-specific DNA-methyltransferase (cytosine-N4-specific)
MEYNRNEVRRRDERATCTTMDNLFATAEIEGNGNGFRSRPESALPAMCVRVVSSSAADLAQLQETVRATIGSAIVVGDSAHILGALPDCAFQTCVTSPPYWSLRDYDIAGQIGLESSADLYIEKLVAVFRGVKRVLRDDGTLWLNIGDSYTSGGRTWRAPDKKNPVRAMDVRPPTPDGLKPKDLIGVPWRLALALQADGWYLRADIIWNKPNCQPESVKDRPTRSHEYIFLLSKDEKYKYKPYALRGPNDRNVRTVWDIHTQPYKDAHFATFPTTLVEPCMELSTDESDLVLDPFLGSGTTGIVALQMRRRFVGIELNPQYVEIAKHRLNGAIIDAAKPEIRDIGVSTNPIPPTAGSGEKDLAAGLAF